MKTDEKYLNSRRGIGDDKADFLIAATFASNTQSTLYAMLKTPENELNALPPSEIRKFIFSKRSKPGWYDPLRLGRGQWVFRQYALEIMTLLGALSLPYCYAASPGNKALYLSDKMRASPGKRLMDTASFVIAVLTPGSFENERRGLLQINKVRLIHALSRYHLQKHAGWDMKWGEPINQEDMAGTNLAFSYLILVGLQQAGFVLTLKEKEDFLFVWRYIGYQMNIQPGLLPVNLKEAGILNSVIKKRNFRKTPEGIDLTAELIGYYQSILPPAQAALVPSQIRLNLGSHVAELVGLMPDPIKDGITSFTNSFRSIQNLLSLAPESYQKMIDQHQQLKKSAATTQERARML